MDNQSLDSTGGGRFLYFAEHLATLHASPDLPWLAGRFEFIAERVIGSSLTILALTDEAGELRIVRATGARPAQTRVLWEALHVDSLPQHAAASALLAARRPSWMPIEQVFPAVEAAPQDEVLVAPLIFNSEILGAGILLTTKLEQTEELAGILAAHAAVAIMQLRHRDEARRLHSFDARLWVPDEYFLAAQFKREINRARRYGREVGLAVLRLENEREILDRYGSFFTDHLLRRIGAQLMSSVRDSDVLGALDGAYAVIHTETGLAGTEISGGRLRDAVVEMARRSFPEIPLLRVSVSIAAYPDHGDVAEDLLHLAAAGATMPLRAAA